MKSPETDWNCSSKSTTSTLSLAGGVAWYLHNDPLLDYHSGNDSRWPPVTNSNFYAAHLKSAGGLPAAKSGSDLHPWNCSATTDRCRSVTDVSRRETKTHRQRTTSQLFVRRPGRPAGRAAFLEPG